MTAGRRDRRTTVVRRDRALCCEWGELRTVAHSYRRQPSVGADLRRPAGPWCTWLKCSHCAKVTIHALIVDTLAARWRRDGCDRERHDRAADRDRRRIRRRLAALTSDGVTVVHSTAGGMSLEGAIVEINEYVDARGFVVRVSSSAAPEQALGALNDAEDLLDEPTRLGPWADDSDGIWRGLAIMDVAG